MDPPKIEVLNVGVSVADLYGKNLGLLGNCGHGKPIVIHRRIVNKRKKWKKQRQPVFLETIMRDHQKKRNT